MAQGSKGSSGRGSRRSSSSRSSSSRSSSSRSASARRTSSARSARSGQSKAGQRRAAKAGGRARGRQQTAQKRARQAGAAAGAAATRLDFSGKTAAELRDAITRGVIRPLNLIMITRDRIEEVMQDAVSRGRVTADDAQELVQGIVQRGRKQTNDVLADLEQLLGRGRDELGTRTQGARKRGATAARSARTRARDAAEPVLVQADRARRAAGVGPSFPIIGYDDLTAAQVQSRLGSLTPAQLRKVRDYERRNANRKSVLDAIQSSLS
jgi:polyhydroxyalkanoate synthesis regulator phasin